MKKVCKRIIVSICIFGLLLQQIPEIKVKADLAEKNAQKVSEEKQNDVAEKSVTDISEKKEAELVENTDFSLEDVPDELLDSIDVDIDEVKDIDDVDILDLNSFTTVNEDNTKTLHIFETPIKYYDEVENEVKFIDNSLERSDETADNGEDYAYENKENSTKVYLPEKSSEYISITNNADMSLLFSPIAEHEVSVQKKIFTFLGEDEKVAEYTNVFGEGYSLQYIPQSEGIKENIFIQKNSGKYQFSFHVKASGLKPDCKEGEQISFLDKESEDVVYTLGKLFIRDSYVGEPDDAEHLSFNNKYQIQEVDHDCYILTCILDKDFLDSDSTQYPVLVDPSISPNKDIYDAPVYSKKAKQNFGGNAYAEIGKVSDNFGVGYGFFQTKSMNKYIYINPKNITKATLRVYEGSGTTYSSKILAYDTDDTWGSSTITWSNKPAKYGKALSSCTIKKSGYYDFAITSSAKSWLADILGEDGFSQKYGIMLVPDSSNQGRKDICTVNHGTASKRPCMNIQYTEDTSIGDGVYYLQNYNSGLNLTVDDKNAIQRTATNTMKQQWTVKGYAGGYYCMANRYYGAKGYLRADNNSDPLPADIWVNGTGDPIRYKIVKNNDGTGTYRILSKITNDLKALTIDGGSKANGTDASFSGYTREAKRKWTIKKVPASQLKLDLQIKEIQDYVATTIMECPLTAVLWSPYENAPASETLFQVFDSSGKQIFSKSVATAAIKGDTPKRVSANWKPQKTGKYTVKVTADSKNACTESNENNNVYSKTINVIRGYKLQVNNYYDEGFVVRYGSDAVAKLKKVTEYTKQFYRDMFGIMLIIPEPVKVNSQLDMCKKQNQNGVNARTINNSCAHKKKIHSEPDVVYRDFQEKYSKNTAANKIIVQWTGHETICQNNSLENNRSFTYPSEKTIVMLNLTEKDLFVDLLLSLYVHELAHNINAPDQYCYNDLTVIDGRKCENRDCVTCYGNQDMKKKCKECIMMESECPEFHIVCREHWNSIMCTYCKKDIFEYLNEWCLPEMLS